MERGSCSRLSGDGQQPHCHIFVLNCPCIGGAQMWVGKQQLSSLVGEWVMRSFREDKERRCSFCVCAWKDVLAMSLAKPILFLRICLGICGSIWNKTEWVVWRKLQILKTCKATFVFIEEAKSVVPGVTMSKKIIKRKNSDTLKHVFWGELFSIFLFHLAVHYKAV